MNNNRILFIGIGQCGNNIVSEFETRGYNTVAINTSELDLKTVDVENKYKIPGASGCARDRKKALSFLKQSYNKIITTIENKFSEQDMVYLVFSLGGGTGSGISPLLLDAFSRKHYKKNFGAIIVAPSSDESIQAKINAVEAYNELVKIPNLKSVFILDNNCKANKLDINTRFVELFDSIVNIADPNKNGVIDEYELERLLTCRGNSVICKFDSDNGEGAIGSDESIFLEHEKDCTHLGVSLLNEFDTSVLFNEFGRPKDVFTGYNNKDNIVIATGMTYPMAYFKQLDADITEFSEREKRKSLVKESIDTAKYNDFTIDIEVLKELDFDTLLKDYN